MAWLWDASSDSIQLADNAALTLPDGDWTISIWVKQTTDIQAYGQRIISSNEGGATNAIDCTIGSTGNIDFFLADSDGTIISAASTGNELDNNTAWNNFIYQRSGNTVTLYLNGVAKASVTNASFGALDLSAPLYIGNRGGGTQNRGFIGSIAEAAKWNRALDATERANLSNSTLGYSPNFYSTSLAWYVPMYSGDYTEKVVGIAVTNTGTTGTTHPPIAYPLQPSLFNNINTFYAPTLVAGSVTLALPLLTNVNTFYDITLSSFFTLQPPLLDSTNVFYGIVLIPGSMTLAPPLLTNVNTFYSPGLAHLTLLDAPFLSSSAVIYPPVLVYTQTILPPFVSSTSVIYAPTLRVIFSLVQPNSASDFVVITPNTDTDFTVVTPNSANDFTEV